MQALRRILLLPLDDYVAALKSCVATFSWRALLVIGLAFVSAWWVYVPIHELCHAWGCLLAGGAVSRLEIDPMYGAAVLHKIFPFVAVGSDYAGQLTGFDTHGNDLTYLATDFCPFTLTILIGIPLLRSAGTGAGRPLRACAQFGAALPVAYAPFISITGDYYEMGSIIVSRLVAAWSPSFQLQRWRSDDLFKLGHQLWLSGTASFADVGGLGASALVGVALIFATYWAGTRWARMLGRWCVMR